MLASCLDPASTTGSSEGSGGDEIVFVHSKLILSFAAYHARMAELVDALDSVVVSDAVLSSDV